MGGRVRTRLVAAPTEGKLAVPCKPLAMRGDRVETTGYE